MKTKLIALIIICLVGTFSGFAQQEKALLWQISGKNLQEPSYLFGTIHIECPDNIQFSETFQKHFAATKKLVLELDLDNPELMANMQALSVNKNMKNISSQLDSNDLKLLNAYFLQHYGADLSQLGVLTPVTLMSMFFLKGLPCPEPGSYELSLVALATAQNKEVLGLETVEDQLAVFNKVSTTEQLSWLVKYANNQKEFISGMQDLVEAYRSKDIDAIYNQMDNFPEYAEIQDDLLRHRNEKWIEPMLEQATKEATFFAVGSAHLASEFGLIELLRKEGYSVKPVIE